MAVQSLDSTFIVHFSKKTLYWFSTILLHRGQQLVGFPHFRRVHGRASVEKQKVRHFTTVEKSVKDEKSCCSSSFLNNSLVEFFVFDTRRVSFYFDNHPTK